MSEISLSPEAQNAIICATLALLGGSEQDQAQTARMVADLADPAERQAVREALLAM
jgi:hypothetical protein